MGLQPLEFSDCYLDSPWLRERIRAHEAELDRTNKFIKDLVKDGKNLIAASKNLSTAQRKFAHSLREFKFEFIGDAETDDERCIDASLQEFSTFLRNLEEQREIMAMNVNETLIKPLERFRKEQLGAVKEEKKKFDKETEKNYSNLDKHLSMSSKKKEPQLQEADVQVEQNRQHFFELSLEYVCKLQEIQERKKFEFVEPMLAFFQGIFTFYHQGYELAKDFSHYKLELQINIQNTRNRFDGTRSEVEELMKKIRKNPHEHKRASPFTLEGYLYVQEKRPAPFGSSWVKHYCMFKKDSKTFTMFPYEHRSGGKIGDGESFILKYCTKRHTDTIDRRFCFDVEATESPVFRQGLLTTMQAFSEEDRQHWIEILGGKESRFLSLSRSTTRAEGGAQLDQHGFSVVKNCINAIESRGIHEQGLYRVVGVSSKVQRLLNLLTDVQFGCDVDLSADGEWEVKTVTSALKLYLRSLPEPLMTYELHEKFINPAKCGSPESRVNAIHFLVYKLPEKNREMLDLLIKHLAYVSGNAKKNLMTVANLGVVFGPTLMRPQEETVAGIMDLKFQNIVVEILIENHEKIFRNLPDYTLDETTSISPRAPPRQSKKQRNKRPVAIYNPCLGLDNGVELSEDSALSFSNVDELQLEAKRAGIVNFPQIDVRPSYSAAPWFASSDNNSSPKEDTPTGSTDSLSPQSLTPTAVCSNPDFEKNHHITDTNDLLEWDTSEAMLVHSPLVSWINSESPTVSSEPTSPIVTEPSPSIEAETSPVCLTPPPSDSVPGRKAIAVYPCDAEHSSELSFQVGEVFEDVRNSREPGWLEGTLNGRRGLIPQNYVQFL